MEVEELTGSSSRPGTNLHDRNWSVSNEIESWRTNGTNRVMMNRDKHPSTMTVNIKWYKMRKIDRNPSTMIDLLAGGVSDANSCIHIDQKPIHPGAKAVGS